MRPRRSPPLPMVSPWQRPLSSLRSAVVESWRRRDRRGGAGVDYVDLEMDIAPKIRRFGKTKRIVSYHNMKTTPVDLQDIAEKCEEFDPDVVKLATAATTLAEAARVLHLATTAKAPTIQIA